MTLDDLLGMKLSHGLEQRGHLGDLADDKPKPLEPDAHRLRRDLEHLGQGPDRPLDRGVVMFLLVGRAPTVRGSGCGPPSLIRPQAAEMEGFGADAVMSVP